MKPDGEHEESGSLEHALEAPLQSEGGGTCLQSTSLPLASLCSCLQMRSKDRVMDESLVD